MSLKLTKEQMEYLANAQKVIGRILDDCQLLASDGKTRTDIPQPNCIFGNCWQSCEGQCKGCGTCQGPTVPKS
jgi:hypothetical protein